MFSKGLANHFGILCRELETNSGIKIKEDSPVRLTGEIQTCIQKDTRMPFFKIGIKVLDANNHEHLLFIKNQDLMVLS